LGSEPAIVAVALGTRKQVGVVLELGKVFAHVGGRPRVISGQRRNVLEIALVRVEGNESIVRSASSKGSSPGIERTLHLGASRRAKTSVLAAVRCLVRCLEVASLSLLVGVVLDIEVPCQVGVLGRPGVVRWGGVVEVCSLVVTGLNEKCLVACNGKSGSQRSMCR
jgi:hypothetical protein